MKRTSKSTSKSPPKKLGSPHSSVISSRIKFVESPLRSKSSSRNRDKSQQWKRLVKGPHKKCYTHSKLHFFFPHYPDPMETLMINTLNYVQKLLDQCPKIELPDFPAQKVSGDNINLTVRMKHLQIYNICTVHIVNIRTDTDKIAGRFILEVPELQLAGNFSVNGKQEGKHISNAGKFTMTLRVLRIKGIVEVVIIEGHLSLKYVNFDFDVESSEVIKTEYTGNGLSNDDVYELLSHVVSLYLEKNAKLICFKLAHHSSMFMNAKMQQRSVVGYDEWIKNEIGTVAEF